MATVPKKSVADILGGMSEEHRRMVAEGMATMHRFAAEPSFKHGKPQYKSGNTVAAIAHAKNLWRIHRNHAGCFYKLTCQR